MDTQDIIVEVEYMLELLVVTIGRELGLVLIEVVAIANIEAIGNI
jgi:hypothetical protein